jgi:hypothetical protein
MQRSEAPERIWATGDGKNGSWTSEQPSREWQTGAVEYALSRGEALTKAEAENARLREALENIIDQDDQMVWGDDSEVREAFYKSIEIARAAIGGDDA